ncbi:MAG TPA: ABC transporter substrate-binding protein, partial [Stellaceae bacterium]|nr:ABC transporter substrate-binding protein [Stellaceae bacterium]
CIRFVQQWADSGINAKLTGFAGLTDATTVEAQGKAALGVMTSTVYSDMLDTPKNKAFVAAYREKTKQYPNLFSDYGYVSMQVIDETLKATDGDASDKDKLAEAMAKVNFTAPRGPFRFDPVTHNPIQNVYIVEEQQAGDRIVSTPIGTLKDVQAPATKEG